MNLLGICKQLRRAGFDDAARAVDEPPQGDAALELVAPRALGVALAFRAAVSRATFHRLAAHAAANTPLVVPLAEIVGEQRPSLAFRVRRDGRVIGCTEWRGGLAALVFDPAKLHRHEPPVLIDTNVVRARGPERALGTEPVCATRYVLTLAAHLFGDQGDAAQQVAIASAVPIVRATTFVMGWTGGLALMREPVLQNVLARPGDPAVLRSVLAAGASGSRA